MKPSSTVETRSRKDAAITFLSLCASGQVREAYDKYVAKNFRHHNPYFRGDAQSLAQGMEQNAAQFPGKEFEVKHVIADGNLVAVHSRVRMAPGQANHAVFHLFRFDGDQIVELWDVGQQEPMDSPNHYGMF